MVRKYRIALATAAGAIGLTFALMPGLNGYRTGLAAEAPASDAPASDAAASDTAQANTDNGYDGAVKLTGDMEIQFFSEELTGGEAKRPTFEVTAKGKLLEGDVLLFENALAVFYGPDGKETHTSAPRCRVDRNEKLAYLEGGVRLETGTMTVELEDLLWDNEKGEATTDKPVTLTKDGGETHLEAVGMTLIPKEEKLVFRGLSFLHRPPKGNEP
ncbi:MAG TPA: LPS export ABC transporter periplasmic protein LptC [Candidatus Hydrogenedentes bacterium]|nr:LPS export ABC transporter periplasmic protein LptC [Candidatus Hydrogenedentota bacterium]